MTHKLSFKSLSVSIGNHRILHNVSGNCLSGTVTAVIGANGAGKSTLLKALTGEIAYLGTVRLGELNVAACSPILLALHRGVLPQQTSLAFPLSVDEVVRLGQIVPADELVLQTRRLAALEKVGMQAFVTRQYHDLSGGEQQRVQMARVLAQMETACDPFNENPKWLFLDEPVSSLDIRHQIQIMNIAREFANRGGGVFAIMHDLNLTAHYADQVLVLKGGQLIASGSVSETVESNVLSEAYDHPVLVNRTPPSEVPFVLPLASHA
ncbi:heme ABC transporter ATP-binding protein [Roseibium sediminis]|uniref:heme ABC transporter ATP-binding protein n=1 Tax=Roseibium sediminis TaxID=1775174 RepID=UPI00123CA98A|nr:heme ABC transporter ATP-binding protein [Roseibium sediminis]